MQRLAALVGALLLLASGLVVGLSLPLAQAQSTAGPQAKPQKPRWSKVTHRISPGATLHARLNASVEGRSCTVSALGPYQGQDISWQLQARGHLLKLSLRVKRNATPGAWRLRAQCVITGASAVEAGVARIHVAGGAGHGLLAKRSGLHVTRVRSGRQSFKGSAARARKKTKKVPIVLGGRGGGSDPGDDYPARWKNAPMDSVLDNWRMYNRECVSFVAWALATRNGFDVKTVLAAGHGNADEWPGQAAAHGYRVDHTPAPGSVAYFAIGSYGHVAYVQRVSGSSVYLEEYNYDYQGHYHTRTIPASSVTRFIHFKDLTPPPPPPPPTTTTPPPPTTTNNGDHTPPSTPANLHVTAKTFNSATVAWNPSTDNVGVAGYFVYVNGTHVANETGTSAKVSLTCGHSYTVGVNAYDVAGNHSSTTNITVSISACPTGKISISPCLDFHNGPGHDYTKIGCIPDATIISIDCTAQGNAVTGPWGTETIWDHTYYGGKAGYVADAYVYTGRNGAVAPTC